MFWRVASALVVLFWAVMTGLVIRDTYFPDASRFAVVPPRLVFDLFLEDAAALNNTLHVYQGPKKIGHTTFSMRRNEAHEAAVVYSLLTTGNLEIESADSRVQDIQFRLSGELVDAERWRGFNLEIRVPTADLYAVAAWKEGDKKPSLEVRKDGQVVMNSAMMETLMSLQGIAGKLGGGESSWLAQMPLISSGGGDRLPFHAREGLMELAGKQRRCYVVTLEIMDAYAVEAYFTQAGELARVELPQGYRLVEPMMHGLERGMNLLE